MLKSDAFKERLLRARTRDEIIAILQSEDEDF
jgi:hypothetical protein